MIWTQVADLISYYDNRYTQLTSYAYKCIKFSWVQHKNIHVRHPVSIEPSAKVDLGAMAMKGYSAFPKAPALLEPHHHIV